MPRIAVINDDTAFLQLMYELLSDEGYETEIYRETTAIHATLRQEQPDLVIIDIRMEQPSTGWQVLEMLRLDPVTSRIPVIVCSADANDLRAKEELLQRNGYASLVKPFDLEDLLTMVRDKIGPATREGE
ncbi:MAG TPA: response regulator [Thermomicrobiaceae bacterium]|nr:response regulator [Thermomicrobiaceae bacterium]